MPQETLKTNRAAFAVHQKETKNKIQRNAQIFQPRFVHSAENKFRHNAQTGKPGGPPTCASPRGGPSFNLKTYTQILAWI